MSHACPLACSFCCSTRDVVGKKRISRSMIAETMARFGPDARIQRFVFTGGDPYLYIADIKAAVADARQAGVRQPFEIDTSGYWAKDEDQVRIVLRELKSLGLTIVSLSYDHEHAKWVTSEQLLTICRVSAELSLRVIVSGTFWNEGESLAALIPELLAMDVETQENLVAPMGRAREHYGSGPRYGLDQAAKESCGRPGFYSLSIYPDGEVYPCCSGGFNIEAKLSCGNVNRHSPETILYNAFTNFHVRLVKEFGWSVLYRLVERDAPELMPDLPRFESVDSSCEICRALNVNLKSKLAPLYATIEKEYAQVRAESEWSSRTSEDGWHGRRLIGDRAVSISELVHLLAEDRDLRLDYLAGVLEIGERACSDVPASHAVCP
jgi:hypothetical protein